MNLDKMKSEIDRAFEDTHEDYEKRRYEILSKLNTIRDYALLKRHEREWIDQVIEFINEKEI